MRINGERLIGNFNALGQTGIDENNRRSRITGTREDKEGRDFVVSLLNDLNLEVKIDEVGNIFGIWKDDENGDRGPVMMGSHIDSVIDAGKYDGSLGVIAGIEVIHALMDEGIKPDRPIVVAAFTNEEGNRFPPDKLGSSVYTGAIDKDEYLNKVDADGISLKAALEGIGYYGDMKVGSIKPFAYFELHVEQGPILDHEGYRIGVVENLQGISWQKVVVKGEPNHAGTTPVHLRKDAGLIAAHVIEYLRERALVEGNGTLTTVGSISFAPNSVNVIPGEATFTVDIRNPNEEKLSTEERLLEEFLADLASKNGVQITKSRMARTKPTVFDADLVNLIKETANEKGLEFRHMTSGAGHDAQMMAAFTKAAMIFIPSIGGISHNPNEATKDEDVVCGCDLLLDVVEKAARVTE